MWLSERVDDLLSVVRMSAKDCEEWLLEDLRRRLIVCRKKGGLVKGLSEVDCSRTVTVVRSYHWRVLCLYRTGLLIG